MSTDVSTPARPLHSAGRRATIIALAIGCLLVVLGAGALARAASRPVWGYTLLALAAGAIFLVVVGGACVAAARATGRRQSAIGAAVLIVAILVAALAAPPLTATLLAAPLDTHIRDTQTTRVATVASAVTRAQYDAQTEADTRRAEWLAERDGAPGQGTGVAGQGPEERAAYQRYQQALEYLSAATMRKNVLIQQQLNTADATITLADRRQALGDRWYWSSAIILVGAVIVVLVCAPVALAARGAGRRSVTSGGAP